MVEVLESLDAHVVSLTEVTKKLSAIQVTGRRHRVVTDDVDQMETDLERVFRVMSKRPKLAVNMMLLIYGK